MSEIGRYIYGIIPNAVTQESVTSGPRSDTEAVSIFGRNSNTSFRLFIPKVVPQGEKEATEVVYAISYQDISAIVSKSEIVDYNSLFRDVLAKLLVKHQKVIEKITSLEYTIIPMKLGTFAKDETEVKDILNKGYDLIKEIMQKITNLIEIDVACAWSDFTSMLKETGEDKEIKEFKERLLTNPKGITIDDQMKVGVMLKKKLDEISQSYSFKIQDTLKIVSLDSKQHELMDEKMVMNAAFLINKAQQKEFYKQIEKLNNDFAEKLNFRCVGPLPPYSFYTLEIKKMEFNDVDWARKRLGILNEAITKDEIKKAFQRQAFIFHPDKNPDKLGAEKEFDQIKRSYDILLDYALSFEQSGKQGIHFNEDEFKKNTVLVRVREDISYGARRAT